MFFSITFVLIAFTALIFYFLYKRNFNYWSRYKAIPSVRGRIFSGDFVQFATMKTHFGFHLKTIYDDPKFENESVIGVYGLYKPSLLIRDPQLLKSIFVKDFDCFSHRFVQPDEKNDPIGSLMLFVARNPFWKEMRSKLTTFFSSAKLKQMYPLIQKVGDKLDGHLKGRGKRFVAEIKDLCCFFTIDVSSTTIVGIDANSLENPQEPINIGIRCLMNFTWFRALNHLCIFFMPKMSGLLGAQIFSKKSNLFLRSTISQTIAERERSGLVRNDLIDIFVKLKEEAQTKGSDMPTFVEGLIAQAAIFMIGGYETSASAISHALMELAKQPELLQILRAEILEAFVEGDDQISYEAINNLKYLDMVIHEIMRLYPLFAFLERTYEKPAGRESSYTLRPHYDFDLPEGMPIYISVYSLHYDERYWSNPKKFDPERFAPGNKENIHPMTYIPFGEGPRNCIGSRLGMLQVKIGLVYFLKNHFVQVCDRTTMNPEFDPKASVVQIKGGIYLEVIRDDMCQKSVNVNKNF